MGRTAASPDPDYRPLDKVNTAATLFSPRYLPARAMLVRAMLAL